MNLRLIFVSFITALSLISGKSYGMESAEIQKPIVREYQESTDLAAIDQIYQDNWSYLYMGKPYNKDLMKALITPQYAENSTRKAKVVIEPIAHNLVGFITYYCFTSANKAPKGHIEQLAVEEKSRRKKYATVLIQAVINELKTNGAQTLSVDYSEENESSKALYENIGFRNTHQYMLGGKPAASACLALNNKTK